MLMSRGHVFTIPKAYVDRRTPARQLRALAPAIANVMMKLIRIRPIIPIGSMIGTLGACPGTEVRKKAMVQQRTSAKGSTPMPMKILAILSCCRGDIFSFDAVGIAAFA
jgi:hypothetical protein